MFTCCVVASQTTWRTATPLAAVLQNSHGNGGGIFLIFVADPITVRSCTNRSGRAERSSQMVFSCMFKQQRRGSVAQRRAAHRALSVNAVCANVEARCDGSAPGTASRPRGPTTAGPADTTRRSGAPTHPRNEFGNHTQHGGHRYTGALVAPWPTSYVWPIAHDEVC